MTDELYVEAQIILKGPKILYETQRIPQNKENNRKVKKNFPVCQRA